VFYGLFGGVKGAAGNGWWAESEGSPLCPSYENLKLFVVQWYKAHLVTRSAIGLPELLKALVTALLSSWCPHAVMRTGIKQLNYKYGCLLAYCTMNSETQSISVQVPFKAGFGHTQAFYHFLLPGSKPFPSLSLTSSLYLLPLIWETKFHTHSKKNE
jgi:hypothetical protein